MSTQTEPRRTGVEGLTPSACREADIDIANTYRAKDWHALQQPQVEPEDRALEVALRNSVARVDWRKRAKLPPRPAPGLVVGWRERLKLLFSLGAYRRNHPLQAGGAS